MSFGGANTECYQSSSGSTSVYRYDVINNSWLELDGCSVGRYKVRSITEMYDAI